MLKKIEISAQFIEACYQKDEDSIKQLLRTNKVQINNVRTMCGKPPLYFVGDNYRLMKLLLNSGADPNVMVKICPHQSCDVLIPYMQFIMQCRPLKRLHTQLIQLLIQHRASIMAKNSFGKTSLRMAVDWKANSIFDVILRHGCNLPAWESKNYLEFRKFYQLCQFIVKDNYRRAETLLNTIEDVDFGEMGEITPLRFAVVKNKLK